MQEVHPNARRRFQELGADLLRSVARFREPAARGGPPGFEPDIVKAQTLTDEDIVGDVTLGYMAPDGQTNGRVVAREGGERVGFVGPGYQKLVSLARAMAKTQPFSSLGSEEFLTEQIFEWATTQASGTDTTDLVDFVADALRSNATELEVIIPISDLHIESELDLAGCRIKTFPKALFERLESLPTGEAPQNAAHRQWCQRMRAELQGFAAAHVRITAERKRAEQLAAEKADIAVGLLRFFAPAHFDAGTVSRIDCWGSAPLRSGAVFITDADGAFKGAREGLVDKPGTMVLDKSTLSFLLDAGLSQIQEITSRDVRTEFEERLLSAILLFGRAVLTADLRQRLVWYCSALESMLLRNSTESVTQNLAERLAIGAYGSLTALRQRMRELAQTRVRFGYRQLLVLLHREGWEVGKERFYRVYTEEGLALRRKRPWRHATAVHREQRRPATARNDIWSMDFVADELSDGRRFRTLTVLDLYTRQCLDIAVGRGLTGQDVVATLERLRFDRGLPQRIYCDNGSEFVGAAMDLWAYTNKVTLDVSRRGKPTDNAAIESFNGRFRDECLNVHWFEGLEDASTKIEAWRQDYNANHPHRALKGLSPNEYARLTMEPAAESL